MEFLSSWSELSTTDNLHFALKQQMETRGRVSGGILTIKMSFGRAKSGAHFSNNEAFEEYVEDEGDVLLFSRTGSPASPFVRGIGAEKRKDNHTKTTLVPELISQMYRTESCRLYHGFLENHVNPFHLIISASQITHKDECVFRKAMQERTIPSNDDIDKFFISIYVQ